MAIVAVAAFSAALWAAPQAFSCAAVVGSAPSRDTLVALSAASDARLQRMIEQVHAIATRPGANPTGPADVRAVVAGVQPDTDAFAAAFEAGMCAHYTPSATPDAERTIRQLGDNIRGAPARMRDAALRGTPLEAPPGLP
ncbi:hypothetical protein [Brevundimonas sp.]|uniref:hypothetical protein n=1 Tax=Brevundimonas sp. TaxID=1871086 RepID=UPI002BFDDE61|nr:hypothetical protein [Brevundimonas sp.]HWQ85168.1 hypothetical protein [Brevundimonas sp.]